LSPSRRHQASPQSQNDRRFVVSRFFLTGVPANHPLQSFITAGIEHGTAHPTHWRREQLPSIDMEIDCNIDELGSKKDGRSSLKATSETPTFKFVVPKEHARMRIDLYLVTALPELSRSRTQQLIRA